MSWPTDLNPMIYRGFVIWERSRSIPMSGWEGDFDKFEYCPEFYSGRRHRTYAPTVEACKAAIDTLLVGED